MAPHKIALIIESDHDARVSFRNQFEKAGYFVITATSGADGLQIIHKISSPAVILINPELIDMDLDSLIYQLKRIDATKDCPIVQIGSGAKAIPGAKCCVTVNDLSGVLSL